jgi:hypothetical protein
MPSSGRKRRVALVRTDVSKERSASIIRETRICEHNISSQRASIASYDQSCSKFEEILWNLLGIKEC